MAKQRFTTFGQHVKTLRQELGLSQETLGAQGFISTPGWIKIENGQRQASEKLIDRLTKWLSENKHLRVGAATTLKHELLTLKYMGSSSRFVRELAEAHAALLPGGKLVEMTAAPAKKTAAASGRKVGAKK